MKKEELFIKAVNECLIILGYYDGEYIKVLYRSSLVKEGILRPAEF